MKLYNNYSPIVSVNVGRLMGRGPTRLDLLSSTQALCIRYYIWLSFESPEEYLAIWTLKHKILSTNPKFFSKNIMHKKRASLVPLTFDYEDSNERETAINDNRDTAEGGQSSSGSRLPSFVLSRSSSSRVRATQVE